MVPRVPDDVLLLIADRIRHNIRDLEGCLLRLLAVASLVHRRHHARVGEEVMHPVRGPEPRSHDPERILRRCASASGSAPRAVRSGATKLVALPRQVAMYLLRQLTDLSLAEIGRLFGGRDHTHGGWTRATRWRRCCIAMRRLARR